jgi:hypothetical protein
VRQGCVEKKSEQFCTPFESPQMRFVVIIVAALVIVGLAAFGLVSAQKGATPTSTAASTVRVASATQNVPALPARTPVSQIAQAAGSEASLLILQARVDAQTGSRMTTGTQAPLAAAAAAPNVKDQSFGPSTISKALVHETVRLSCPDACGRTCASPAPNSRDQQHTPSEF